MSQPDDGRYKSRGRKERTPEQLKVLAMAREKAKLVIAEKTKIKKEMARAELPVEDSAPTEVSVPPQPSLSRDEIQNLIHSTLEDRRPPERKYALVDGMYVKIK